MKYEMITRQKICVCLTWCASSRDISIRLNPKMLHISAISRADILHAWQLTKVRIAMCTKSVTLVYASWAQLRGHKTGINYVDTKMSEDYILVETFTMRVLNPLLYNQLIKSQTTVQLTQKLLKLINEAKSFPKNVKVD